MFMCLFLLALFGNDERLLHGRPAVLQMHIYVVASQELFKGGSSCFIFHSIRISDSS